MRIPMLLLAALPLGCDTATDTGDGEDPADHACEQAGVEGTVVDAAASLEDAGDAPVALSEEPWTVRLVDGAPGYVGLEVDEEVEALLFLDTADVLGGVWRDGAEEDPGTPTPVEACPDDLPEHLHLELVPGSWALELGPAAVDRVGLVLLPAEDHVHD